jgi:hypothetical protein
MGLKSRILTLAIFVLFCSALVSQVKAQLLINELLQTQRGNDFSQIADTGEFIELYNSSGADLNLDGWMMNVLDLDDGNTLLSIPLTGTITSANPYYVIANATSGTINPSVINLDTGTSDFLVDDNNLYEIRNPLGELVDALGVQLAFDPQFDNVTTEQRDQIGGGGWGQLVSTLSTPQSYGRYRDGEDTNKNGRDFGLIPQTPGTSNNLPEIGHFPLPDVDNPALPLGAIVPGFSYSFHGPTVVDPTVTGPYIKRAIPSSPQGGNAITAWDNTGGGNMIAGDSLSDSFDIYAYLDTINVGGTGVEVATYGVAGTTDALFATPDPTGELLPTATETNNGNTGVGWVFIKQDALNFKKLLLVDFSEGGDSREAGAWTILETIDLASQPSAWARLAVDYDPVTGEVIAHFNNQVFTYDITQGMVGTFYVGYRVPSVNNNNSPPIFDFYKAVAGLAGDFNNDGKVDGQDLLVWQRNPAVGSLADWKNNYGTGGLAAVAAVPEPGTALLAATCGLALCGLRKRG